MKRWFNRMVVVLVAVAAAAPAAATELPDSVVSQHVVVISIDGLRPDAIEEFGLETIARLMEEGSYALDASTILPSKTLPSHTSMLTGRTPEGHGITFNNALPGKGIVEVPTIFELARANGYHTAAFYSKAKFRHLERENSYDHWQAPSYNADNWMATRTVPDAIQYMRHHRPNLLFIHIGETDYAGHGAGWMGFFYGLAAQRADGAVEHIIDAADDAYGAGNYTVILTADHGGHDRTHGTNSREDMTIPWIVYGKGVAEDMRPEGVRTMDTAATALWLLGLPIPESFDGVPVSAAFTYAAAAVAGREPVSAAGDLEQVEDGRTGERGTHAPDPTDDADPLER